MKREEILREAAEVATLPAPASIQFKGKTFYVARQSGAARDAMATYKARLTRQIEARGGDGKDATFREADLAAMGWCDENGAPVFDDIAEGSAILSSWDGELQAALAEKFIEINNLSAEAAEKNSEASQS